jgi:hypothetical protein
LYATDDTKLGLYAKWIPLTSHIIRPSIELEFYDLATSGGKLELDDTAPSDSRVNDMEQELLQNIIPNELRQQLPGTLRRQQEASKIAHLAYRELVALQPSGFWKNGGLRTFLGYGEEF